jgi:hypothetical protein
MMQVRQVAAMSVVTVVFATTALAQAPAAAPPPAAPAAVASPRLGALAPDNLARPRPKPPFDLTGLWLHAGGPNNSFRFSPPEGFTLTPAARVHYDAARKAQAEGKAYRDDIGQCWPAGMPVILTRVWPIAMVQLPTVIYMTSEFMNSLRIVYLDGRTHSESDVVVPSHNGESIGRWEGDALVVDTTYFAGHHHWLDSGIPISDQMHLVERIRKINDGKTLEIEFSATDPKSWVGTWTWTKRWNRVDDRDIAEVSCYPDLNEHMPSTKSNVGGAQ